MFKALLSKFLPFKEFQSELAPSDPQYPTDEAFSISQSILPHENSNHGTFHKTNSDCPSRKQARDEVQTPSAYESDTLNQSLGTSEALPQAGDFPKPFQRNFSVNTDGIPPLANSARSIGILPSEGSKTCVLSWKLPSI